MFDKLQVKTIQQLFHTIFTKLLHGFHIHILLWSVSGGAQTQGSINKCLSSKPITPFTVVSTLSATYETLFPLYLSIEKDARTPMQLLHDSIIRATLSAGGLKHFNGGFKTMVDYRIERIPETTIDGKLIDIGYKLFAILADGTEKQIIYCDIDTLFEYIRTIHNDRIDY